MGRLTEAVVGLSICISTTSPSMISVSSLKKEVLNILHIQNEHGLLDPDSYGLAKCLSEGLRLPHFQGEDL